MWKRDRNVIEAVRDMDQSVKAAILESSAVFFTSDSVAQGVQDAVITAEYDGTIAGFESAAWRIRRDPIMETLGTPGYVILGTLTTGTVFLDLTLDYVDAVVLQRVGRHIVHINRTNRTNRRPTTPGVLATRVARTLVIDLADWRKRATEVVLATAVVR